LFKSNHYKSGFTLIEVMVVVAIAAILLAVAAPSIKNSLANSEVLSAQEDIVKSIKKAKQYAKALNMPVSISITLKINNNSISFQLPDGTNNLPDGTTISGLLLPQNITVGATSVTAGATTASHTFSPMGIIDAMDVITVTSTVSNTVSKTITILNLFGQLKVN